MELSDADEAWEFENDNNSVESGGEMVRKPQTKNHN